MCLVAELNTFRWKGRKEDGKMESKKERQPEERKRKSTGKKRRRNVFVC
jgi:hypothetical protein